MHSWETKIYQLTHLPRRNCFPFQLDEIGWMIRHRAVFHHVKLDQLFFCLSFHRSRYDSELSKKDDWPSFSMIPPQTVMNAPDPPLHDELFFSYRAELLTDFYRLLRVDQPIRSRLFLSQDARTVIGLIRSKLDQLHIPGAADALDLLALQLITELAAATDASRVKDAPDLRIYELAARLRNGGNLTELIPEYGFSRRLFYLKWKETFECPPVRYRTEARLDKAATLLLNSSLSIAEIAEVCGFSSTAYFYECFTRAQGIPPGDYRRNAPKKKS